MSSFNKVILVGNLTRDPQLKYLPSGMAVCEIGLAVNNRWKDKDGNQREEVCFVDAACFGKSGEVINQYMAKGRSLLIEGRLKYDTWNAQDGTKRSKHSIVIENFTFLGNRDGGGQGGGYEAGGAPATRPASQVRPQPQNQYSDAPAPIEESQPAGNDDIPF